MGVGMRVVKEFEKQEIDYKKKYLSNKESGLIKGRRVIANDYENWNYKN
jgi:hypothetical protein